MGCGWTTCQDASSPVYVKPAASQPVPADTNFATRSRPAPYATALYTDADATLDDLREAVTTLEDVERTARRVFGGANPTAVGIERRLRKARATLASRETPSPGTA